MFLTILIFIVILGILVFVHEFGHFVVARKSGMKVDEFGFGFPPRLVGIQKIGGKRQFVWGHKPPLDPSQTVYSINLIPLGGFVKILGENNEGQDDPRSFINKGFWPRFFTLVAGVAMNVLLAWALISIGFMVSLPTEIDNPQTPPAHAIMKNPEIVIADVLNGSPAAQAGLMPGDVVLQIDGKSFVGKEQAIPYVRGHAGQSLHLQIKRIDVIQNIDVTAKPNPELSGQGMIGVEMDNVAQLRYPWYYAVVEGGRATGVQIVNVVSGLYQLVTGKIALSNVGGPVAIAKLTGQARRLGFITLVQFTAFLSLNLAVLNILPFPALDGGRVLFLIIEKIRRKKNNQAVEQFINTAGFVALLLLMVLVTIKDIVKK